ncbi:MAG: hypothetical protein RBJ76_13765 [Stenomitos frigidus ULC029]
MASPFADAANAVLTFQVGTGQFTTQPGSYNPVEVMETVRCVVLLKPVANKASLELEFYEGADETWQILEGFWVDPLPPPNIPVGAVGELAITTGIGITKTGSFRLAPTIQNPYVTALGIDFIGKLRGLFRETEFVLPPIASP